MKISSFHAVMAIYRAASIACTPFLKIFAHKRLKAGKELADKYKQRFGISDDQRPKGPLVWIHAASIGESKIALAIADHLLQKEPELSVLLTTQTISAFQALPAHNRILHQMVPWDTWIWVQRFLDHWKPDFAYNIEAELWPCLWYQTHRRKIPAFSVNFHISSRAAQRWRRFSFVFKGIISCFSKHFSSCQASINHFKDLVGNDFSIERTPSLKMLTSQASSVPKEAPADHTSSSLASFFQGRLFWMASCIHENEFSLIQEAHTQLRKKHPNLLLICIPRHPKTVKKEDWTLSVYRSTSTPLLLDTSCYIVDTFGELGLFYELASFVVLGGSLTPQGKGHNPAEPAGFSCGIIHGPFISNNQDLYEGLAVLSATHCVHNLQELVAYVDSLLRHPHQAKQFGKKALDALSSYRNHAVDFLEDLTTQTFAFMSNSPKR